MSSEILHSIALSLFRCCSKTLLTVARLELFWQLWPSEQLLSVTAALVPGGLGLEPKMEFYSWTDQSGKELRPHAVQTFSPRENPNKIDQMTEVKSHR